MSAYLSSCTAWLSIQVRQQAEALIEARQMIVEGVGLRVAPVIGESLPSQSTHQISRTHSLTHSLTRSFTQSNPGAVDIAKRAADSLTEEGIPMSDAAKSRMVSNLICVVAGDSNVQPVLQLS